MGSNLQASQRFSQEPLGQCCVLSPQWTKYGCASGEKEEESTRLFTVSRCHAPAFEGLLSMDYQRQGSCEACSLPLSSCWSGLWDDLGCARQKTAASAHRQSIDRSFSCQKTGCILLRDVHGC